MAKYRAVTKLDTYGLTHIVQVKYWWWPLWKRVASAHDMSRAREYAENHSRSHKVKKTITPIRVDNHG